MQKKRTIPNKVVIAYTKTDGEFTICLDGQPVTRGELFQRLEALLEQNPKLKLRLTGDIKPEENDPDQLQLMHTITAAGVDPKNLDFDPGVVERRMKSAEQQREAAVRRIRHRNHLENIGQALDNYHIVNDQYPPARGCDKKGKPLLSWRVHILPFLDEQELYEKFKLDEPWDSEHNKKLLAEIPD